MAKDLYLFDKETTQRVFNAVRKVETHPPIKPPAKGRKGDANLLVGKISGKGSSSGYYDVVQVAWNGSAWATMASGLTWDGESGNLPELYELNGETLIDDLIDMSVDIFVFPYLLGATDGTFQWVFDWIYPYAVKVSGDDTTPGHLADKLRDFEGNPVGTVNDPGGDEQIWLPPLGDVTGPASAYDTSIARFDGVTGKLIEDSKGFISDTGIFKLNSADDSNHITLEHDNTNALVKWDDGDLVFETKEGTNEPTVLKIVGHGTGIGELQVHDEDSGEYLDLSAAAGVGSIQVLGSSPAGVKIQPDGLCDAEFFPDLDNGLQPKVTISGKDSGNFTRTWEMQVIGGESNTFLMAGISLLKINSNVNLLGEVTISNAYTLPNADGNANDVMKTNGGGAVSWVSGILTDEKIKISANDTTADYLLSKVVVDASKWLALTEVNDGGDEDLKITHIGPVSGSVDTIGSAAEGAEAAESTTYDGTSSANGLDLYVQSRTAYYHAGDEKLYGYVRKLTFDARGHLQAVGAETRIEIEVLELC